MIDPPQEKGSIHTHDASSLEIAVGESERGEWRLLVTMVSRAEVPAGHLIGYAFTKRKAIELSAAIIRAVEALDRRE
jgi:hypothetical protein